MITRTISSSFVRRCCVATRTTTTTTTRSSLLTTRQSNIINNSIRCLSSNDNLPYHLVVGMPALSPTMEVGTISEWHKNVGDEFIAGDSLASIETDKATIDFEAQDDGYIAKILIDAGTSDINVGTPVLITVEEEDDVSAFENYILPAADEPAAAATATPAPAAVEPEPIVEAAAAAPTPPPPPPTTAAPAASTPPPPPAPSPPPSVEPVVAAAAAAPVVVTPPPTTMSPIWGNIASKSSPLIKTLSNDQKKYIDLYGTTGQLPM